MRLKERRRSRRIIPLLRQEERVTVQTDSQQFPAKIVNLGLGGALLDMRDSGAFIHVGRILSLFFENGGRLLEVRAMPARSDGRKVAFKFRDLTATDQQEIETKMIRMGILEARVP
jgi:PilZ domain